jgi:hypothetical protein
MGCDGRSTGRLHQRVQCAHDKACVVEHLVVKRQQGGVEQQGLSICMCLWVLGCALGLQNVNWQRQ